MQHDLRCLLLGLLDPDLIWLAIPTFVTICTVCTAWRLRLTADLETKKALTLDPSDADW